MKFEDARVEQAYIESRHDEMLLACARMNGLFCMAAMTTYVSPMARFLFGWYGGCREGFNTTDLMQRGFLMLILALIACLFYMPGMKKRMGFRCCEVYVTCVLVFLLHIPIQYSQRSAHGWVNEEEADFTPVATCYYYAEFTARTALTMDCAMTVIHIMVPIRWSIMFWIEVMYVIIFNMQSFLLLQKEGDFSTLVAFNGLIIGASVGLRSIEKNHRLHFSTLIRERELRAGAEFEAELGFKGMMKRRKKKQESREDTASNAHSAPSTTATGRVFAQIVGNDSLESDLSLLVQLGIEEQWLLNPDTVSFSSGAVLGHGGFGTVVEASFCGGSVAVKHYTHSSSRSKGGKEMQPALDESSMNELRILRHVRHPHIVLFHGALIGEGFLDVSLVFEKIVGTRFDHAVSDIHEWKRSNFGASISRYQHALLCGVCEALTYLHTRRTCVVHADVKPGNIMVENRNKRPFPKLLDFGLSRIATRGAKIKGGTRHYTAPEVLSRSAGRASPAVDVFAFGQLLFYAGSGQHPKSFRDDEQTWKRGPGILMQWKATIQYCRRSNPAMRPTMKQVSEMIFFSSLLGHSDSEGNDKTEEEQSQADAQAEVLQHAQTTGIRRKAMARHLMEAIEPLDEVSKTTRRVDRSESDPEIGRQTAARGLRL